jgi:hypothetical protein
LNGEEPVDVMHLVSDEPDFYLYEGDGNRALLGVVRACRIIDTVTHRGRTIFLVTLDPPVPKGAFPPSLRTDVVGLSNDGGAPLEQLASGDVGGALIWELFDATSAFSVGYAPNLGHGVIYKDRPNLDSKGYVIRS